MHFICRQKLPEDKSIAEHIIAEGVRLVAILCDTTPIRDDWWYCVMLKDPEEQTMRCIAYFSYR